MQPFTAKSTSAESNTIKGAFPPNSKDNFFTVLAHCSYNILPEIFERKHIRICKNVYRQIKKINRRCIRSVQKHLPTLVEPVKDNAATFVLLHKSLPTVEAFSRDTVTTLITPF